MMRKLLTICCTAVEGKPLQWRRNLGMITMDLKAIWKYRLRTNLSVIATILSLFCVHFPATAAVYKAPPINPDPNKYYLFYMHGGFVETFGDGVRATGNSKIKISYDYSKILNKFSARGLEVIGEARRSDVPHGAYAKKIAGQIRSLISSGVSPSHIVIGGHSKGGQMALLVSAMLGKTNYWNRLRYLIAASCRIEDRKGGLTNILKKLKARGSKMRAGYVFNMYDHNDDMSRSCGYVFKIAEFNKTKEVMFKEGSGHQLFYQAKDIWIGPAADWIFSSNKLMSDLESD